MGWINQIEYVPKHQCSKPSGIFGDGSVWQCDDCGQRWVFKYHQYFGGFWVIVDETETKRLKEEGN